MVFSEELQRDLRKQCTICGCVFLALALVHILAIVVIIKPFIVLGVDFDTFLSAISELSGFNKAKLMFSVIYSLATLIITIIVGLKYCIKYKKWVTKNPAEFYETFVDYNFAAYLIIGILLIFPLFIAVILVKVNIVNTIEKLKEQEDERKQIEKEEYAKDEFRRLNDLEIQYNERNNIKQKPVAQKTISEEDITTHKKLDLDNFSLDDVEDDEW